MFNNHQNTPSLKVKYHPSSTIIISHHQSSSVIISHDRSSAIIISHYKSSSVIISHHLSFAVIIRHHHMYVRSESPKVRSRCNVTETTPCQCAEMTRKNTYACLLLLLYLQLCHSLVNGIHLFHKRDQLIPIQWNLLQLHTQRENGTE